MFALNKVTITFISEMILMVVLITALIISVKKRKKITLLRFFPFYLGYFLFVFICGDISYFLAFNFDQKPLAFAITSYTDYSSTLIELLVFLQFVKTVNSNQIVKQMLLITIVFFIIYFVFELQSDRFFPSGISEKTQSRIYTLEAIIILNFSSFSLIKIFKNTSLTKNGIGVEFWIIVGYFLFAVCTLPYSIIEPWLRRKYSYLYVELYSLFYIFYTILFCFIIKAYVTKSEHKESSLVVR
jgi:hypothetical protein